MDANLDWSDLGDAVTSEAPTNDDWSDLGDPVTPKAKATAPGGRPAYVPDPNAYVKSRKTVGGKEYLLHQPTGKIYDPDGNVVDDPAVLKAFGKTRITKAAQREMAAQRAGTPDPTSILTDLGTGWANLKGIYATNQFLQAQQDAANAGTAERYGRAGGRNRTPEEIAQRRTAAEQAAQQALGGIVAAQGEAQSYPQSPLVNRFNNAATFGDAWQAFAADPYTVTRSTVVQSAPVSIPSVVGGIAGSLLGPAGSAAGAGYGSYLTELGASVQDALQQNGANLSDPASIAATWKAHAPEITAYAQKRAAIIGGFDAATGGLSSKIAAISPKNLLFGEVGKEILGTGAEAAGGMAGEAAGELATTGTLQPGQILGEGLGEAGSGAVQTGGQIVLNRALGTGEGKADRVIPQTSAPGKTDRIEPRLFPQAPAQSLPAVDLPKVPGWPTQERQAAPPVGTAPWAPGSGQVPTIGRGEDWSDLGDAVQSAPAPPATSSGPAVWANKDADVPVTILDQPAQMGNDGRMYPPVQIEGQGPSFVPADELKPVNVGKRPVDAVEMPTAKAENWSDLGDEVKPAAPRDRPPSFVPTAEHENAYKDFYKSKGPITAERLAEFMGGDVKTAGRVIQNKIMSRSIIQTKTGRLLRAPVRAKPLHILEAIASYGGMKDQMGEAKARDITSKTMTPYGPVIRPNGLNEEDVLTRLQDDGYLRDPGHNTDKQLEYTPDDIYRLIDQHQGGKKVYSEHDQAAADAIEVQRKNDLADPDLRDSPAEQRPRLERDHGPDVASELETAARAMEINVSRMEMEMAAQFMMDGKSAEDALEAAVIRAEDHIAEDAAGWPEMDMLKKRAPEAVAAFIQRPSPFEDQNVTIDGSNVTIPDQEKPADEKPAGTREDGQPSADAGKPDSGQGPQEETDTGGKQEAGTGKTGAEDGEAKPGNTPAVIRPTGLFVRIGSKQLPMQSYRQASEAYVKTLEATGATASGETGPQAPSAEIVDAKGVVLAHISQNGRVWPDSEKRHQSSDVPLYDPRKNTALAVEPGAEGKPQLVIPGAEQISQAEQAKRGAAKPLKPKAPQKGMEEGLFGDGAAQSDFISTPPKAEAKPDNNDNKRTSPDNGAGTSSFGAKNPLVTKARAENQDVAEQIIGASKPILGSTGRGEPVFYSALLRSIEGMKQEKAPAAQWLGMVRNAPGVKAEEVAWLGLEDWLNGQTGAVTKAAILDYLRANQVTVSEVVKGGKSSQLLPRDVQTAREWVRAQKAWHSVDKEQALSAIDDALEVGSRNEAVGTLEGLGLPNDILEPFRNSIAMGEAGGGMTKFASYQLPGGEDYRELLLTLPKSINIEEAQLIHSEARRAQVDAHRAFKLGAELYGLDDDRTKKARAIWVEATKATDAAQEKLSAARSVDFRSSHFDEPNILAHVRFNERTDADGKRVLFVEEVQSDWHQQGRKKGYGLKPHTIYKVVNTDNGRVYLSFSSRAEAEANIAGYDEKTRRFLGVEEYQESGQPPQGVPDAPFKTTWPELALKRMIRYAAENGFDKIAWTPGDVQAERYDLSKQIKQIIVEKHVVSPTRTDYDIRAYDHGDNKVIARTVQSPEAIADVIGKEATDKAMEQIAESKSITPRADLRGLDLKVGGEGMKGFYDSILVAAANKLGKKFGAKVRQDKIPTTTNGWGIKGPDGSFITEDRYNSANNARIVMRQRGSNVEDGYEVALDSEGSPVTAHSLPITPELRTAAMGGMPLFKDTGTIAPTAFVASKAQVKAVNARAQSLVRRILGHGVRMEVVTNMPGYVPKDFIAAYDPSQRAIWLTMKAAHDMAFMIGHEALHDLRNIGAITDGEWKTLVRAAREGGFGDISPERIAIYRQEYRGTFGQTEAQFIDRMEEEAVADMLGAYVDGYEASGAAQRIMARIREFIESILSLMKGEGFTVPATILRKANSGALAARTSESTQSVSEPIIAGMAPDDGGRRVTNDPMDMAADPEARGILEDLAGNINLRYINEPEDVKDVLRDVARGADGFLNARRGVIPNDQTRQLAAELGLSYNDLMKREQGDAFNAENIFAARVLLLKSAKRMMSLAAQAKKSGSMADLVEFHKAFTRHAAIQEQVAGMTAEAGRALQQFKMLAGDDYFQAAKNIMDDAKNRKHFGPDAVRDLADMVDQLNDPAQIGKFTRDAFKVTIFDMLREIWINSLLSGLRTHATNILSNTLTALWQVPETAIATAIGALHRGDKVTSGEAVARFIGLIEGTKEGLQAAKTAFKTGEPADLASKLESHRKKAVPGMVGEIVRLPSRALLAEDELFKTVNYRAEINALAVRLAAREGLSGQSLAARIADLRNTPTKAMERAAHEAALYNTFQNKLGPIGNKIMGLRDSIPGAYIVVPFIRTPANIIKYAAERTPFGLAMRPVRDNLAGKNGNVARDTQMARLALGSAVAAAVASLALAGVVSGGGPDDDDKKAVLRASGWQPYSIKIGSTWYSYQRFDPLAFIVGVTADAIDLGEALSETEFDKIGAMVVGAISGNLLDKTWVSGLSDFINVLHDPERYGPSYIRRLGGTAVPTLVAQIAQTMDPVMRDARTMLDQIKARIPWVSKSLPPRRNIFGEEIRYEGSLGPDLISPVFISTEKDNPVAKAMIETEYFPSMPQRKMNGHNLTPEQYDRYTELAGKEAVRRLTPIVKGSGWASKSRDFKEKKIKAAYDDARDWAKIKVKNLYPELKKKAQP